MTMAFQLLLLVPDKGQKETKKEIDLRSTASMAHIAWYMDHSGRDEQQKASDFFNDNCHKYVAAQYVQGLWPNE